MAMNMLLKVLEERYLTDSQLPCCDFYNDVLGNAIAKISPTTLKLPNPYEMFMYKKIINDLPHPTEKLGGGEKPLPNGIHFPKS